MPTHTCPACQTVFEVKAIRTPEPGEHVDFTPNSEPGSQTAVPPSLARVGMSSPTSEYEVEIPDERYKREGGEDQAWFKGLEPVEPDDDDYDTPAGVHDVDLFDRPEDVEVPPEPEAKSEPEPEPAPPPSRGDRVLKGGQSHPVAAELGGTVEMVVLGGYVPGVKSRVFGTLMEPAVRVAWDNGEVEALPLADVRPAT